MVAHEVSAKN